MTDDIRLLALTHLRAALNLKDWRAVSKAYALLGGVGAGVAVKGGGDALAAVPVGVGGVSA